MWTGVGDEGARQTAALVRVDGRDDKGGAGKGQTKDGQGAFRRVQ